MNAIHFILSEVLSEGARSEYRLYISPRRHGELLQLHHVAVSRRMEHPDRTLWPPSDADRQMQDLRRAVLRGIENDYRRSVRPWADPRLPPKIR